MYMEPVSFKYGKLTENIHGYTDIFIVYMECIAERPVRPNITGCVVDNWNMMNCSWDPPFQDTGIDTTQQLVWKISLVFIYVCIVSVLNL